MRESRSNSQGPPWGALFLVGHHLDPTTLATASCASKSWFDCLSSDRLWQPLCSAAFPSLATYGCHDVPYRRLYSVGCAAARRRLRKPPKPALSLDSLLFALRMESPACRGGAAVKPCGSLKADPNGLFRFDVDVAWTVGALDGVRVAWHVVVQGWKEVFCMMECTAGTRAAGRPCSSGWFSEELPSPGCCSSGVASGLVGDLRLGLRFLDDEVAVEKVSVGLLSMYTWRYVSVDDALAYLQHFLHPPQLPTLTSIHSSSFA